MSPHVTLGTISNSKYEAQHCSDMGSKGDEEGHGSISRDLARVAASSIQSSLCLSTSVYFLIGYSLVVVAPVAVLPSRPLHVPLLLLSLFYKTFFRKEKGLSRSRRSLESVYRILLSAYWLKSANLIPPSPWGISTSGMGNTTIKTFEQISTFTVMYVSRHHLFEERKFARSVFERKGA
jgi:hypothetical protein